MFGFLKQVGDYTRDAVDAARNLAQGFSVTFDHMQRRPVTVQYPYEKLILPSVIGAGFTTSSTNASPVRCACGSARSIFRWSIG